MKKLRVFLTGVSGYLGSILAEHFQAMPEVEAVTGIALSKPRASLPSKVKFMRVDIRSPRLAEAMAGHDVVVHTACVVLWPAGMPKAERDDINQNGIRNVVNAALTSKVGRFVHTSSMAAYDPCLARGRTAITEDFPLGNGTSPFYYWNGKALAEPVVAALSSAGVLVTIFRPIYIIGPRNRSVAESYRRNAVRFPGRDPRRQFIHEQDVAAAFTQALRTEMPGAYNVVPDDCMRLNEVWQIVGSKSVPMVPLTLARLATWLKWRYLGSPIHSSWVRDMIVDFTGSNLKLRKTGWRPRFTSAEALKSALE